MQSSLINSFIVMISLATASGVFLHDTRIDKAASVAIMPLDQLGVETGAKLVHTSPNDLHTHVERTQLGHSSPLLHSLAPSIAPRNEDKKHLAQKVVPKGHHPFDNYNLPIIS